MRISAIVVLSVLACVATANAQDNPYHITEAEKTACLPDAMRLCSSAYPDETKLVTCMTANRKFLGANCAAVFKAGKKDRGMQ